MKKIQIVFLSISILIAGIMLPGAVMAQGMIMQRSLAPVVVGGGVELPIGGLKFMGAFRALPAIDSEPLKIADLGMQAIVVGMDGGAVMERKMKIAGFFVFCGI